MKEIDKHFIGKYVIIRTYSAGVWAGKILMKEGMQVVLTNARRLWMWKAKESISLSAVALYGIDQKNSRIAPQVCEVGLDAIEIISTSDNSEKSIQGAPIEPAK